MINFDAGSGNNYLLNDGFEIPKLGLGTYKLQGLDGVRRMSSALDRGYRLLDSAFNYENEGAVGAAIRQSGVPREEITVTSKLPGRHHVYEEAVPCIQESLLRLGLDYLDLYLIHWPNPIEDKYLEAWQALIDAQKMGLIRSIGVCNFLPEHIDRLVEETGVAPVVNQIELHPYFNQEELVSYHQDRGIIIQSWSPIGRYNQASQEPVIKEIASQYGRSAQQVILNWHIQKGFLPIPKSGHSGRQWENLQALDFELSQEAIQKIDQLNRPDGRNKDQDPAVYQEF
ncbi:aldo/keto reductase [Hutsoniella sourekii]